MSDATAEAVADSGGVPPPKRRRRHITRFGVYVLALVVAIIAGLSITVFRIDLGPALKKQAEKRASDFLHRPMHIGKLSATLTPGLFIFDNVVIEGPTPADRPFLVADHLSVRMPWWTLLPPRQEMVIDSVEMTGWRMLIERGVDGKVALPKFTPDPPDPNRPSRYKIKTKTTTAISARDGQFTYDDHGTPWSVVARGVGVQIVHANGEYRGTAQLSNGTVAIQNFLPMRADMQVRLKFDGALCRLENINLITDGAQTQGHGVVDFGHWPEQTYDVTSRVNFPRMRDIFFANDHFSLVGDGTFKGTFHIFKDMTEASNTGRSLTGTFASDLTGINLSWGNYRLTHLAGSLAWLSHSFEVKEAKSDFYGGRLAQHYSLAPIGIAGHPSIATWDTKYDDVDVRQLGEGLLWPVLRLAATASGENALTWPNGNFHQRTGTGVIRAVPADGGAVASRALPASVPIVPKVTPFDAHATPAPFQTAGEIHYRWEPEWIDVDDGWAATRGTYVTFHGRTAYGDRSELPFHLTSLNWQESDQLLVAIMDAFQSPAQTPMIDVGGYGAFDGTMTEAFWAPRIAGKFSGDAMRAWDVTWGKGDGDLVIQNSYVDVTHGVITGAGPARILADGRYSLGYPRKDKGEEMRGHVQVKSWPAKDLKHPFEMDEWPIEGAISADLDLHGPYAGLFGSGHLHFDDASAWKETFDAADGEMQFEGNGVRINAIDMHKSSGVVHGAAWFGWDKSYSFSADGERIPVESLKTVTIPKAKLTGLLKFSATGSGNLASPEYEVHGSVADLFANDEGVGQVAGTLYLRNQALSIELNAASSRLTVSGFGRIALNDALDADMTIQFNDTSVDPYLKFVTPKLPSFMSARMTGSLRVTGGLADRQHVIIDGTVTDMPVRLRDYDLHNDGVVHATFKNDTITVDHLVLAGEDTELSLTGTASVTDRQIRAHAGGNANLAVLERFVNGNIATSGGMKIDADVDGSFDAPVFSGRATIADGRFRDFAVPHAIEAINGTLLFDAGGIRLQDVRGKVAEGDVLFGGRIGFTGFVPDELSVTAHGTNMRLRYPEGFQSRANADLELRGTVHEPLLTGTVVVTQSLITRRLEAGAGMLGYFTGGGDSSTAAPLLTPSAAASSFPLTYEVRVLAGPSAIQVDIKGAQMSGGADLTFRGTYDKPIVTGRVEIQRGEVVFQGNLYHVRPSSIEFNNPNAIQPFFDIVADTRVRVPNQDTYNVTVHVSGTKDHLVPEFSSSPPLPEFAVVSLLFGDTPDIPLAELQAVGSAQQAQLDVARAFAARLIASPISDQVGRVFDPLGVDTAIIPEFLTSNATTATIGSSTQLNPSARVVLGKRISSQAFVTYSRELSGTQYEVIVLEFEASDKLSWVISRNEDQSFSLDFRVRHIF